MSYCVCTHWNSSPEELPWNTNNNLSKYVISGIFPIYSTHSPTLDLCVLISCVTEYVAMLFIMRFGLIMCQRVSSSSSYPSQVIYGGK